MVIRDYIARFIDSQSDGKTEFCSRLKGRGARRGPLSHRSIKLIGDLDAYLDLRLARFIVWREARRRRK